MLSADESLSDITDIIAAVCTLVFVHTEAQDLTRKLARFESSQFALEPDHYYSNGRASYGRLIGKIRFFAYRDSREAVRYQDHRERTACLVERGENFRWEAIPPRAAGRMYVDSRGANQGEFQVEAREGLRIMAGGRGEMGAEGRFHGWRGQSVLMKQRPCSSGRRKRNLMP